MEGCASSHSGSSFPDLDDTYRSYIVTACARWITGFSDGRFKPYSTRHASRWPSSWFGLWVGKKRRSDSRLHRSARYSRPSLTGGDTECPPLCGHGGLRRSIRGSGGCFMPVDGITRGCSAWLSQSRLSLRSTIQEVRSSSDYTDKTGWSSTVACAGTVTASASADGTIAIDNRRGCRRHILPGYRVSAEVASVSACQLKYDPRTVRVSVDLAVIRNSG